VDVIDTGANRVGVLRLLEHVEKLEVALGRLNRDDVGVEACDVLKDVVLQNQAKRLVPTIKLSQLTEQRTKSE
jgi:hypothetical protein